MFNTSKDVIQNRFVRLEAALSRLDSFDNWEKKRRGGAMEVSLDPMRDLCARLGSPEVAFRAAHVAGSKGKGTVTSLVADALHKAGVRVGQYTSPHVERINERVVLCGQPVADETLAGALERVLDAQGAAAAEGTPGHWATWFDLVTAAAFLAFADAKVELAVVECGLGGRLDSTNVVHGVVAAVSNVYLEHTSVLGSTRVAIASEKAGIIKAGARVVVGALSAEDEAARLVERVAEERGAPCRRVLHASLDGLGLRNVNLARAILAELETAEPELAARHGGFGLGSGGPLLALPGRLERRQIRGTAVVLDGAHVPESLELVLRDLLSDPALGVPPVVLFGVGEEKNARGLLKAMVGRVDRVLCSSVGKGPFRGTTELVGLCRELGLAATAVPDPRAALDEAVRIAGASGWVLVTGSLHLVGAVRGQTRP